MENDNVAKKKSNCPIHREELKLVTKKCKTPLKKQILEEINPDTVGYIARYFFTTGYEAGKRMDLSEKEKIKMLEQLLVKFREFVKDLPKEIMT